MHISDNIKRCVSDLAAYGGAPIFTRPISTSNLVKPDFERFLSYCKIFYEQRRYTNGGPLVNQLESRLADFHGTRYCVAYANGFWSLVAAIRLSALPDRTDVLMPSLTYRRLADVVSWAGLRPRFCEVDESSLAIDPKHVASQIDDRTALILAVHPIVNTCDAPRLCEIAGHAGLPIIFDSVESVYETIKGIKVGSFGDAECFSMHASKLINGFEGGYVTTNNEKLAHQLAVTRSFGFAGYDNVESLGFNAKLSEVHAAMALAGLDDLEEQVSRNRERYRLYQRLLINVRGLRLIPFDEREKTSFKNIVVELLDDWPLDRERTIQLLNAEGALVRAYYSPPLHRKPMAYPHVAAHLPITDRLEGRFMLFPCGHQVSTRDIEQFVELLIFICEHASEISEDTDAA